MINLVLIFVISFTTVISQSFEPYVKDIGGTFCKFLAFKAQLPRKYFNLCPEPSCAWDDWNHALKATNGSQRKRYIVSYGHNGFGNQLWEHSAAFNIAESMKGQLLIAAIPDNLSPGGVMPPNTWTGMGAMERLLPQQFLYENLPANSEIRKICDNEHFVVADRPVDWRDKNYTANFRTNLINLITDKNPRCLKLVGYFQNMPLCVDDTRRLWTKSLVANFTMRPGDNDISIYLRCVPRHYHFNDKHFYENILNHTSFDRVWLFQAPECPTKLGDNPAKDGVIAAVVRLLVERYNATRWPGFQGKDESGTSFLLHDLAGLTQSKKLILPVSSWAYWAGFFSNATEIHVNAPPHHNVMYGMPQYIYHDDKHHKYFGRYNATENDIVYGLKTHSDKEIHLKQITKHGGGHHTAAAFVTHNNVTESSKVNSTTSTIEVSSPNVTAINNTAANATSQTIVNTTTIVTTAAVSCVCGSHCTLAGVTFGLTSELYRSMCPSAAVK